MKKLIREALEDRNELLPEIYDILLDIANLIIGVYGLEDSEIEFMGYDRVSDTYSGIINNVTFGISIDEMELIMDHLYKEYGISADQISIEYIPASEGIRVSLEI